MFINRGAARSGGQSKVLTKKVRKESRTCLFEQGWTPYMKGPLY